MSSVVHCSLILVFQLAVVLVSFLSLWQKKLMVSFVLEVAVCGWLALLLWACDEAAHLSKREAGERAGLGSHDLLPPKVFDHLQGLPTILYSLPQSHIWGTSL